MTKVLVCDAIAQDAVDKLTGLGYEVTVKTGMGEDELIATAPGYSAMIVRSATKVTAKVIAAATDLKVVLRGGVGIDNIDSAAAKEHGVHVRNTPAASSNAVAELTIGLMFALARKVSIADSSTQAGKWEKKKFKGSELSGKALGLIDSGRIGSLVAKIANALGMTVSAYDPYITEFEYGSLVGSLDEIIESSDFISLHIPFNSETENILDKPEFIKMKKNAFIINCARGGVVNEEAFAQAVKDGEIAGGSFDVFRSEPLKESPLRGIDSVILTPHIGASTSEGQARIGGELIRILKEELPL